MPSSGLPYAPSFPAAHPACAAVAVPLPPHRRPAELPAESPATAAVPSWQPAALPEGLQLISIKRRRVLKMKRHQRRKRRKLMRKVSKVHKVGSD